MITLLRHIYFGLKFDDSSRSTLYNEVKDTSKASSPRQNFCVGSRAQF